MRFLFVRVSFTHFLNAPLSAMMLLALCSAASAGAQQMPNQGPPPPSIPGVSPNTAGSNDPGVRHMTEEMSARRNAQRQQQIVTDTAHLLDLAQKLNDEVSKSNKDTLSISVVKEADEIEKLAKTIKEKMRDGQ